MAGSGEGDAPALLELGEARSYARSGVQTTRPAPVLLLIGSAMLGNAHVVPTYVPTWDLPAETTLRLVDRQLARRAGHAATRPPRVGLGNKRRGGYSRRRARTSRLVASAWWLTSR